MVGKMSMDKLTYFVKDSFVYYLSNEQMTMLDSTQDFKTHMGLDSLDITEIIMHLEETLNTFIPDEVSAEFKNIQDMMDYLVPIFVE